MQVRSKVSQRCRNAGPWCYKIYGGWRPQDFPVKQEVVGSLDQLSYSICNISCNTLSLSLSPSREISLRYEIYAIFRVLAEDIQHTSRPCLPLLFAVGRPGAFEEPPAWCRVANSKGQQYHLHVMTVTMSRHRLLKLSSDHVKEATEATKSQKIAAPKLDIKSNTTESQLGRLGRIETYIDHNEQSLTPYLSHDRVIDLSRPHPEKATVARNNLQGEQGLGLMSLFGHSEHHQTKYLF